MNRLDYRHFLRDVTQILHGEHTSVARRFARARLFSPRDKILGRFRAKPAARVMDIGSDSLKIGGVKG